MIFSNKKPLTLPATSSLSLSLYLSIYPSFSCLRHPFPHSLLLRRSFTGCDMNERAAREKQRRGFKPV